MPRPCERAQDEYERQKHVNGRAGTRTDKICRYKLHAR